MRSFEEPADYAGFEEMLAGGQKRLPLEPFTRMMIASCGSVGTWGPTRCGPGWCIARKGKAR